MDHINQWLVSHDGTVSPSITDAKEFFDEKSADDTAERHGGMVLGWVQ
jgi:hypothetical protein